MTKRISILLIVIVVFMLLSAFGKGIHSIKIGIDWNGDSKENGFVTITKKEKQSTQEGSKIQNFDLNFYENSKKIEKFSIQIEGFEKNAKWSAESSFVIDSLHQKKSFVLLHNGFPACGYAQNYFLFVKNIRNQIQKLDEWDTYFDAPYGTYQSIKPISEHSFSRVTVSINGSDKEVINDEEEFAVVTKSDSIIYYQEKDRWFKKHITPKGSIFWEREMKLDDALKIKL